MSPDHTAVRVALWRALHVQIDAPPHIFEDEIGLKLAADLSDVGAAWRERPDMNPDATKFFRASIVARARFVEDLVADEVQRGVRQCVILGAGLDTFAQRRPDIAGRMKVFEIDQPATQAWKQERLKKLGLGIPGWLRFVPVDFEAGESCWRRLTDAGFDATQPAIVACTGVSMYPSKSAINATLRQIAALAPASTLAMTFLLPIELADPEVRAAFEIARKGASSGGTPFVSFFTPEEMMMLAREAGFRESRYVLAADLAARYFTGRTDSFRLGNSEALLIANT